MEQVWDHNQDHVCVCGRGGRLQPCSGGCTGESRDYAAWRESRTMESNKENLEWQGLAPVTVREPSGASTTESSEHSSFSHKKLGKL